MLVLTRKAGQSIVIGDRIVVRVTAIEGGRCRIGIEAPRDVRIRRDDHVGFEEMRAIHLAAAVQPSSPT